MLITITNDVKLFLVVGLGVLQHEPNVSGKLQRREFKVTPIYEIFTGVQSDDMPTHS